MDILPKRYSIFCGENSLEEIVIAIKNVLKLIFDLKPTQNLGHLEESVKSVTGQEKAWFFSTARMGLYSALKSLDLKEGSEVILPAFTCVVVPNSIIYAGLKPIYSDIIDETFSSCLEQYKKCQSSKTKVIYIQHTFGIDSKAQEVIRWAKENNYFVIEDCAHSFGDQNQGKAGDLAIYSLDHSKVLNLGFGGFVVSSNSKIIEKINQTYFDLQVLKKRTQIHILCLFIWEYFMYHPALFYFMKIPRALLARLGFLKVFSDELIVDKNKLKNYPTRLSEYLAEIGISQIKRIEKNNKNRIALTNRISGSLGLKWKDKPLLRVPFLVKDRALAEKLFGKRIELGIWFTTIFQGRTENFKQVYYQQGSCPRAEFIAKHIFNFPTHSKIPSDLLDSEKVEKLKTMIVEIS